MDVLHPLHGEDYKRRFDDQKDRYNSLFDVIRPIFEKCGVMTLDVLQQMVHILGDMPKASNKTIKDKFNRYLQQNRITYVYTKERINLLFNNQVSESQVQKVLWKFTNSQTNYGLDYALFCDLVPTKNTNLQRHNFTITLD
jgi:hypothetical protein